MSIGFAGKRTRWISGKYKPAQPGVYERRGLSYSAFFAMWTGHNWLTGAFSIKSAARRQFPSALQNGSWRGLAENHLALEKP